MIRRITDLFKNIFRGRKGHKERLVENEQPVNSVVFQGERKKPRSKWLITHNRIQAQNANKLRKRRAKNKQASKSRKINYRKAA